MDIIDIPDKEVELMGQTDVKLKDQIDPEVQGNKGEQNDPEVQGNQEQETDSEEVHSCQGHQTDQVVQPH